MRATVHRRSLRLGRNLLRNTEIAGVSAGTPGTGPRGWKTYFPDVAAGVTSQVVGTGYEDGLAYVDWRLSGTPVAAFGSSNIFFTPTTTNLHARQNEPFTLSAFVKLQAGAIPSYIALAINELDAAGAFLANTSVGITPATPPTAWSLSDHAFPIALTGNNLVATKTSGSSSYDTARADTAIHSGEKKMFSVVMNAFTTANELGIGVGNATASLTNYLGVDNNSIAVYPTTGSIYRNGSSVGSAGSFSVGDVCDIAIDRVNSKFYARVNGGNWNNSGTDNPATNTGGLDISAISGDLYPALTFWAVNDQFTATFKPADFPYAAPSGFTGGASGGSLRRQRFKFPTRLANASTAAIEPNLGVGYSNGVAFDVTLRIGLPQLERGAAMSPPERRPVGA